MIMPLFGAGCVRAVICTVSVAFELAREGGEPLSQLHGKEASSISIFLQVTTGFSERAYVTYHYFVSINDFSHTEIPRELMD